MGRAEGGAAARSIWKRASAWTGRRRRAGTAAGDRDGDVEVRLGGRIDRVDVAETEAGTFFWIVDYKTGRSVELLAASLKTVQRAATDAVRPGRGARAVRPAAGAAAGAGVLARHRHRAEGRAARRGRLTPGSAAPTSGRRCAGCWRGWSSIWCGTSAPATSRWRRARTTVRRRAPIRRCAASPRGAAVRGGNCHCRRCSRRSGGGACGLSCSSLGRFDGGEHVLAELAKPVRAPREGLTIAVRDEVANHNGVIFDEKEHEALRAAAKNAPGSKPSTTIWSGSNRSPTPSSMLRNRSARRPNP